MLTKSDRRFIAKMVGFAIGAIMLGKREFDIKAFANALAKAAAEED